MLPKWTVFVPEFSAIMSFSKVDACAAFMSHVVNTPELFKIFQRARDTEWLNEDEKYELGQAWIDFSDRLPPGMGPLELSATTPVLRALASGSLHSVDDQAARNELLKYIRA
jgi:hypothetical protein